MKTKNYWLIKSEPTAYSWAQLEVDKHTVWGGIRNFAARKFLRMMQKDELVFFYHSQQGKEIVGIAQVLKEAYPDPTNQDPKTEWTAVDIAAFLPLQTPISLIKMKQEPKLSQMILLRQPRLSVMPVTSLEFQTLLAMAHMQDLLHSRHFPRLD